MKLLKWCLQNEQEQWMMYTYEDNHWKRETNLLVPRRTYFCNVLGQLNRTFDFALVNLYLPYHQALYTVMPNVQIIIQPEGLYHFARHFFEVPVHHSDEVAVGLDWQLKEERDEILDFLRSFYSAQSLKEAKAVYVHWQYERSLWNEAGNKLLLMMNLYENEVLNYFKYQSILKEILGVPLLED